jgi:hypothetical protein
VHSFADEVGAFGEAALVGDGELEVESWNA